MERPSGTLPGSTGVGCPAVPDGVPLPEGGAVERGDVDEMDMEKAAIYTAVSASAGAGAT